MIRLLIRDIKNRRQMEVCSQSMESLKIFNLYTV
nr:MAG TPA: hypothetical protein [Caudoviricetes sp.]